MLVLKIWYQRYSSSHVCEAVFDGSRKTFKNDDINKICILPANLLAKITDINSAMFFQDQCNLPDEVNNHTRLQSNRVGKAFECAIREENGAAETVHGNTNFTISGQCMYLRMRECVNIFSDWK